LTFATFQITLGCSETTMATKGTRITAATVHIGPIAFGYTAISTLGRCATAVPTQGVWAVFAIATILPPGISITSLSSRRCRSSLSGSRTATRSAFGLSIAPPSASSGSATAVLAFFRAFLILGLGCSITTFASRGSGFAAVPVCFSLSPLTTSRNSFTPAPSLRSGIITPRGFGNCFAALPTVGHRWAACSSLASRSCKSDPVVTDNVTLLDSVATFATESLGRAAIPRDSCSTANDSLAAISTFRSSLTTVATLCPRNLHSHRRKREFCSSGRGTHFGGATTIAAPGNRIGPSAPLLAVTITWVSGSRCVSAIATIAQLDYGFGEWWI
jgi:hypothetical protein